MTWLKNPKTLERYLRFFTVYRICNLSADRAQKASCDYKPKRQGARTDGCRPGIWGNQRRVPGHTATEASLLLKWVTFLTLRLPAGPEFGR